MSTKIIKLRDNNDNVLLPVSDASAVQYNDSGSKISVQTAIDERIKRSIYLGTCTTAAATGAKVATVETFPVDGSGKPLVGTEIAVKYTNTDSAKAAHTLNVNGTGAAQVWYNTGAVTSTTAAQATSFGTANQYIYYVWDGTYWIWTGKGSDSNSTYTNVALGQGKTTACGTAAGTAAKTASLSNYALTTDGIVTVVFTNGNTAANATLNINSKGAKAIYWKDAACPTDLIKAGDVVTMIYNTQYHIISIIRNNEHTYTASGNNLFVTGITQDKEGEITNVEYGNLEDLNIPVFEGGDPGLVPESTNSEVVKVLGSDGQWKIVTAAQTVEISYNLKYCESSQHQNVDIQDTQLWGSFADPTVATSVFVGDINVNLSNPVNDGAR